MPLLKLSDGRTIGMPANATQTDWTNAQNLGEAQIAAEYGAQAAKQNAPVVDRAGNYVYSATNRYGNNWFGHAGAWADHNIPGAMAAERALGAAGLNAPVGQPGGGAAGLAGRIGTAAATYGAPGVGQAAGIYDIGASAYNALKDIAGVKGYEAPTILGTTQRALGVPGMDPNASTTQQVVEAIGGGAPTARSLMGAIIRPTAAVIGGNVGEKVGETFDPRLGRLGALAGSFAPGAAEAGATRVPRVLAGETAPETAASAAALGLQPSFTSLASPRGKMLGKSAAGWSIVGQPIESANATLAEGLLNRQQQAANEIATQAGGAPINHVPGRLGMSEGDIGQHLIDGARRAATGLRQALEDQQQNFADRLQPPGGPVAEVNVPSIRAEVEAYMNDPRNGVTAGMRNLVEPHLQAMEGQTQGTGPQPNPNYQPTWNLHGTDTLPWDVMRNQRREINDALSNYAPGQATPDARLLGALDDAITNSMTRTANGVAPGMGQEFNDMNQTYAYNQKNVLPQFDRVGGKPVTYQGVTTWNGGMIPGQAYAEVMSPQRQKGLTPFVTLASENPYFPRESWAQAAGGIVSKLGEGESGSHRPDMAARQWNSLGNDVKGAITGGPNGQPLQAAADLDNVAQVGAQTVLPPQRHGLTSHAGAFGTLVLGGEALSHLFHGFLPTALATGALAGTGYGLARGVESQPFKSAMAGDTTSLTDTLYRSIPSSAITMSQIYPQDSGAAAPAPPALPPAPPPAAPPSMPAPLSTPTALGQ